MGTGLIGASIGLALKANNRKTHITGWDPTRAHALAARRRGAIDEIAPTPDAALRDADLIVLAGPVDSIVRQIARTIAAAPPQSFIIDVGSLKAGVAEAASRALRRDGRGIRFVAGHPLAGSERAGARAAHARLFRERPFALYAPPQRHRAAAWRTASSLVRSLGAKPVRVDPAAHDASVAATSALPQLSAIALVLAIDDSLARSRAKLSGPGFEDATRLAQSPFLLWKALLSENRGNVLRTLHAFADRLGALTKALERGDDRKMAKFFRSAAAARRRILAPGRRTSRPRNP